MAAALAVVVLFQPLPSRAAERVVRMLVESDDGRFTFEPTLLFVQPGDQVRFVPDSPMHAVKSISGMLPEHALGWRGRMGGETLVRLDVPGVYGIKCMAHYEVGMVALIVVGDQAPANWSAAQTVRHPPMADAAFDRLFAQAACRLPRPAITQCQLR